MKQLQFDDVQTGMLITVLRGFKLGKPGAFAAAMFGAPVAVETDSYDRSYLGSVLRVEHWDAPFVVVRELVDRYGRPPGGILADRAVSLDLREYIVAAVSPEYHAALTASRASGEERAGG